MPTPHRVRGAGVVLADARARTPQIAEPPVTGGTRGQRTRDALLGAARSVAAELGWHAVTVRRVAERAGCSPALVYAYFASKDALLLELVRDGFHALRGRLEVERAGTCDAAAALRAMGRAYWAFAREHADLYQVMYGLGGTRFPVGETRAEGAAVGAAFVPVVTALAVTAGGDAAGPDAGGEAERRLYTLWATVHGLVALVLADRIEGGWPAGEALAERAVADAIAAWRVPSRPAEGGAPT